MAAVNYLWTGAVSTDVTVAGNYTPSGPPAGGDNGDTLTIDGRAVNGMVGDLSATIFTAVYHYNSCNQPLGTILARLKLSAKEANLGLPSSGFAVGGALVAVDFGTQVAVVNQYSSASTGGTSGLQPTLIIANNVGTVVNVFGGVIGIATMIPGETSSIATVQQANGACTIGAGVTLASGPTIAGGGMVVNLASDVNCQGGTVTIQGAFKAGTVTVGPGTVNFNNRPPSGTAATAIIMQGGTLSLIQNADAVSFDAFTDGPGTINQANPGQISAFGTYTPYPLPFFGRTTGYR